MPYLRYNELELKRKDINVNFCNTTDGVKSVLLFESTSAINPARR